jgi:hypothetical protein
MVDMKKLALLLVAVLVCSILGGCQMENSPGSSQSGVGGSSSESSDLPAYEYSYNPYALPSLVEEKLGDSLPVYKAAIDAIEERVEFVPVKDEGEFQLVTGVLKEYYPPFALVTAAEYSAFDAAIKFSYRYNGNIHAQKISEYPTKFEKIFKLALKDGDGEVPKAMGIYLYATSSMFESGRSGLTAWDALNGEADHNSYAEVLGAALLQAGVDCLKVETKGGDGTPHLMILAKLEGSYYYMDPFGETVLSDGVGLAAFGMTQKDCVKNGYLDSFILRTGSGSGERPPAADDSRFSELRLCAKWRFDEKRENIVITVDGEERDWGPLVK